MMDTKLKWLSYKTFLSICLSMDSIFILHDKSRFSSICELFKRTKSYTVNVPFASMCDREDYDKKVYSVNSYNEWYGFSTVKYTPIKIV